MAASDLSLTIDLEPTEQAKAFVRSVVIEALRELVAEESWLSEQMQQVAEKATKKAIHRFAHEIQHAGRVGVR